MIFFFYSDLTIIHTTEDIDLEMNSNVQIAANLVTRNTDVRCLFATSASAVENLTGPQSNQIFLQ